MSKKLKIGIIGAGGICRNVHLPSLSEMDNCEVVAICDHHEEKAREMDMYIQKFCGCIFSEQERYLKPKKIIP